MNGLWGVGARREVGGTVGELGELEGEDVPSGAFDYLGKIAQPNAMLGQMNRSVLTPARRARSHSGARTRDRQRRG